MIKSYPIEKSPLYRLRNKKKLASLLNLQEDFFKSVQFASVLDYKQFEIEKNTKRRLIQSPGGKLKIIQKRILKLLSRIETPNWLMSGKKGHSYIDNAIVHSKNSYVYTIDIKNFYPSCKEQYIHKMFRSTFQMSPDIAAIMTRIVSHNGVLPTGAPTSPLISFWTYHKNFERLAALLSDQYGIIFSLYIDDMTLSGNKPIPKQVLAYIEIELKKVELRVKRAKTKYYKNKDFKVITGVAINPQGDIKVPNRRRLAVIKQFTNMKTSAAVQVGDKVKILGRIRSARQIESNIFRELERQVHSLKSEATAEE